MFGASATVSLLKGISTPVAPLPVKQACWGRRKGKEKSYQRPGPLGQNLLSMPSSSKMSPDPPRGLSVTPSLVGTPLHGYTLAVTATHSSAQPCSPLHGSEVYPPKITCLYPGEYCFLSRELGWHLWHFLGVSCWWWDLSQLMWCVSAARPFWVTNPRLDIQDTNPLLQELCQPNTWSFFFLRLWSGFVVVQKLFSQHSFPARQQSSYWDQSVMKDRKCNTAFIWKFFIHLCVFLQGGKPPKVQLEQPPSSAVPIVSIGAALTPVPVPRALRQGPPPQQGRAPSPVYQALKRVLLVKITSPWVSLNNGLHYFTGLLLPIWELSDNASK